MEKRKMSEYRILKGFENYGIFEDGRIINLKLLRYIDGYVSSNGNLATTLRYNGKPKTVYIHRLVAQAWIPTDNLNLGVTHKDGDKYNNAASNLEWVPCNFFKNKGVRR